MLVYITAKQAKGPFPYWSTLNILNDCHFVTSHFHAQVCLPSSLALFSSVQCRASWPPNTCHLYLIIFLHHLFSFLNKICISINMARIISNRNDSWVFCERNSIFQWKVQHFTFDMNKEKLLSVLLNCSPLLDMHFVWDWAHIFLLSWDIHLFLDVTHENVIHHKIQCPVTQPGEMRKTQVTVTASWAASLIPGTLLILPSVLEPLSQQGFSDRRKVTRS